MSKKILVVHVASHVGKSAIVVSLLHPRMNSPRVFSVDKQNFDASAYGIEVVRFDASGLTKIMDTIAAEPGDLIVDVGFLQFNDMMREFSRLQGAINDFDIVIVPTTPDRRAQEETITTVLTLLNVGLETEKLRIIFNRMRGDPEDGLEDEFDQILAFGRSNDAIPIYDDLVIRENDLHSDLRIARVSFQQMISDCTDYKAAVTEAVAKDPNSPNTRRLIKFRNLHRAAVSANAELDAVFSALLLPPDTDRTGA